MGRSDPTIIAQMEEVGRNPVPHYVKTFNDMIAKCDQLALSPDVSMKTVSKVTRAFAILLLEMDRAEAEGEDDKAVEIYDGIMTGTASFLAVAFDSGSRSMNKAMKITFLEILDEAIKERARSARARKTCRG